MKKIKNIIVSTFIIGIVLFWCLIFYTIFTTQSPYVIKKSIYSLTVNDIKMIQIKPKYSNSSQNLISHTISISSKDSIKNVLNSIQRDDYGVNRKSKRTIWVSNLEFELNSDSIFVLSVSAYDESSAIDFYDSYGNNYYFSDSVKNIMEMYTKQ